MSPHRWNVLWIALAWAWIAGCSSPLDEARLTERTREYDVVVVLLDAAAAGHFSFLGYDRDTTPNLARVADEAIVFENAVAQASATPLSVLSLFTSRYPLLEHAPQVQGEIGPVLPADVPALAGLLAERYASRVGVSANSWISGQFGYGSDFTTFHEVFGQRGSDEKPGTAERVSDVFLQWLEEHSGEPYLAYVHYYEPHAPYTPPPPYDSRFDAEAHGHADGTKTSLKPWRARRPPEMVARAITALYDGNLAYADAQVERVVQKLKELGRWDRTIFVVLSDHGEAFWQHGTRGHGLQCYEEFIHVPLMIRIPDLTDRPLRVKTPVELIDLLPTLLDLAQIDASWAGLRGRSLVPLLLEGDAAVTGVRAVYSRNHELASLELAMRKGSHKMIQQVATAHIELFDLAADPGEAVNLFLADQPGTADWNVAREMAIELQGWIDDAKESWKTMVAAPDSLDPALIERLKAMGYLN